MNLNTAVFKPLETAKEIKEGQLKAIRYAEYAVRFHKEHLKAYDQDNPERVRLLTNAKRFVTALKRSYSLMLLIDEVDPLKCQNVEEYNDRINKVEDDFFKKHNKKKTFYVGAYDGNVYGMVNGFINEEKPTYV